MKTHSAEETVTSYEDALFLLKEGNRRYLEGTLTTKDSYEIDREKLKQGQHPFAVILCCSDSRVAPEIFFDEKLGDIFVIRNAGNVVDDIVLGSIEYAVQHLNTPLIVVCGHSKCGAVTAACEGGNLPAHIQAIADRMQSVITRGRDLEHIIRANTEYVRNQIVNDDIIQESGVRVVGAHYDICSGVVTWI